MYREAGMPENLVDWLTGKNTYKQKQANKSGLGR